MRIYVEKFLKVLIKMINSSKLELFCILYIDIVLIIRLVAIVGQMNDV